MLKNHDGGEYDGPSEGIITVSERSQGQAEERTDTHETELNCTNS